MDERTFESLISLLDYSEDDECKDYEAMERPGGHIYEDIARLRRWALEVKIDYSNNK